MMHPPLPQHYLVYTADIGALLAVLGASIGNLPALVSCVAGGLGGIWYAILIWEHFFGPHK